MGELQQPVFPADLAAAMGIQIKTLGRMIKNGSVPPPDVRLTAKTRYWFRQTLLDCKLLSVGTEVGTEPDSSPKPLIQLNS